MMLGFPPLPTEEEMQRSYEAGMEVKRIMRAAIDERQAMTKDTEDPRAKELMERLEATRQRKGTQTHVPDPDRMNQEEFNKQLSQAVVDLVKIVKEQEERIALLERRSGFIGA